MFAALAQQFISNSRIYREAEVTPQQVLQAYTAVRNSSSYCDYDAESGYNYERDRAVEAFFPDLVLRNADGRTAFYWSSLGESFQEFLDDKLALEVEKA